MRRISAISIMFIGLGLLALWGCTSDEPSTDDPSADNQIVETAAPTATPEEIDIALLQRGVDVYLANYCGTCHTLAAAQTTGTFGPPHNDEYHLANQQVQSDSYTGSATTPTEYILESLIEPGIFYTPGYEGTNHHMPAFGHLPEEDLDALVYLLSHQRGG